MNPGRGAAPTSRWGRQNTRALLLFLLSLPLVQCSSADNMPAKTADQEPSTKDDGFVVCPDDSVHSDEVCGWNSILDLNVELQRALGLSRIVTCEDAQRFQRGAAKYLEAHPEFFELMNDRFSQAGWPECSAL